MLCVVCVRLCPGRALVQLLVFVVVSVQKSLIETPKALRVLCSKSCLHVRGGSKWGQGGLGGVPGARIGAQHKQAD